MVALYGVLLTIPFHCSSHITQLAVTAKGTLTHNTVTSSSFYSVPGNPAYIICSQRHLKLTTLAQKERQ